LCYIIFIFRPDCIGTVLWAERDKFDEIKERLRILLENQITHFRYTKPFEHMDVLAWVFVTRILFVEFQNVAVQ
jgi:hypothetical protein